MEGTFSRKMSNEQIPDRKPSYRKAVGANTTKNQAKNSSFQNDAITSSDPVVARINSDVELNGSGSGKKIQYLSLLIELNVSYAY